MRTNLVTSHIERLRGHRDQCQSHSEPFEATGIQCQKGVTSSHRNSANGQQVGTQDLCGTRATLKHRLTHITSSKGIPLTTKTGYTPGLNTHHHRYPFKRAWPGSPQKWELGGRDQPFPFKTCRHLRVLKENKHSYADHNT